MGCNAPVPPGEKRPAGLAPCRAFFVGGLCHSLRCLARRRHVACLAARSDASFVIVSRVVHLVASAASRAVPPAVPLSAISAAAPVVSHIAPSTV